MSKRALTYGLIAACMMALFTLSGLMVMGRNFDYAQAEIFRYLSLMLCMISVFLGIRSLREHLGGELSFMQGMGIGTQISLVAALLFGLFTLALYAFTGYPQQLYESATLFVQKNAGSPEAATVAMARMEAQKMLYTDPLTNALTMVATVFPIGMIVTAISAFLLKQKA